MKTEKCTMHYNIINNKNQLHEKAKDITLGIGCRISYGARCAGSGDDWGRCRA